MKNETLKGVKFDTTLLLISVGMLAAGVFSFIAEDVSKLVVFNVATQALFQTSLLVFAFWVCQILITFIYYLVKNKRS